jgi:hypothetical protein
MDHPEHEGRVEQLTAGDPRLRDGGVRDGGAAGQPLHEVTPGLDPFERVRSAALRAVLFTRALSRDVAAVIDKGVAAASEEAKLAWQRWSPPAQTKPPTDASSAPPSDASTPPAEPSTPPTGSAPPETPPTSGG